LKTSDATTPPVKVGLISLGCAKNLVDAEIMLGALLREGMEIINDAARADVLIINTCSFVDAAQEESVDTILESATLREASNRGQGLIVAGCLPQRFGDELPRLLPEVDVFMGIDQVAGVADLVKQAIARRAARRVENRNSRVKSPGRRVEARPSRLRPARVDAAIAPPPSDRETAPLMPASALDARRSTPLLEVNRRPTYIPDYATPRYRLTPRHFAYVKIAEGCNHPCSFCIIPRMRGSHRSRPQADIVAEAKALIEQGVKEINLISQDSTYYGLDLRPGHSRAISSPGKFSSALAALPAGAATLSTLLRELNALPGDFWIRLLYTHPAHWTDELIATMAACSKVARYVDLPLQHIHENMLERMRRETSRGHIEDLLRRIRAGLPGIALRTTFIVGFPGETEACFQSLLEFIRSARFERLGVFTYSREAGTRAAAMAGQVPDRVKQRRRRLAMAAQREIARECAAGWVGRIVRVLVEGRADGELLRRSNVYSWEHGLIREPGSRPAKPGALGYLVARSEADAPDIDGRVFVRRARHRPADAPEPGRFARVRLIGHTDYDLIAEPL
jgi:ribosomal protein S12 methylthiotransferase